MRRPGPAERAIADVMAIVRVEAAKLSRRELDGSKMQLDHLARRIERLRNEYNVDGRG